MTTLVERAKRLSPGVRRWQRLLSSLDLSVQAESSLEPLGDRDFIICGIPRSGTSLLAGVLYQPPACVTVMEPWDGLRMEPADLMRSLRREIGTGALRRGRLDVPTLSRTGEVRWGRDGDFPHAVKVRSDHALCVKWPAYWHYLAALPESRFLVCIRDPVEVITSFERTGGRLAQGLEYDVAFNREMNHELLQATSDPSVRRALLYEYIAARIAAYMKDPNVLVVRYERWYTDAPALMDEIASFLSVELRQGTVAMRPAKVRAADPLVVDLVRQHCPSARTLGYSY